MSTPEFAPQRPTPILQFGTSRFLQAHADLFVSEALAQDKALGAITIVQSSGDASRRHRLDALAAPEGFPVRIQGLQNGRPVAFETRVTSVARALALDTDLAEVCRIVAEEAEIILSNTGDTGWATTPADNGDELDIAMSYPAKLTHLLRLRHQANGRGLQIMPTELVARNGDVLKARVLELAGRFGPDLAGWIEANVVFVNSIVDRIVSEPIEPAGAVAEPYALWAIEDCKGLHVPCTHNAVKVVPALAPYEKLKLHILNLGHTYLVERASRSGHAAQFVRELVGDAAVLADLRDLYDREVLPVFEMAGIGAEARAYVDVTIDRFANPYLDHRLSDIAQNHSEKIRRRIAAFLDYAREFGGQVEQPRLRAIMQTISERE